MMSAAVAEAPNSPWATKDDSDSTTHVALVVAVGVGAVPCAEAVATSKNQLLARTTTATEKLRLFMTPSKEALTRLPPSAPRNHEAAIHPSLDGSKRTPRTAGLTPRGLCGRVNNTAQGKRQICRGFCKGRRGHNSVLGRPPKSLAAA